MHHKTIAELAACLRRGEFTSTDLTRCYLARIERLDPHLNSYISVDTEGALEAAGRADVRLSRSEGGPLTGIPIAHKDIFCTKGLKTSCGSRMLDSFIAPYNATVVERLERAGAVVLGKTNMDEFAMGSSNETSFYGPVRNPWDLQRVPGGSSTATDTGGSIRQPASFCGVTGIKPTYGRVSRYGIIAYGSSLDQGGVIARTAEDCALILQAMAGFDPRDSNSVERPVPDYPAGLDTDITGLRIGIPEEWLGIGLDPAIDAVVTAALTRFEAMGARVERIRLPHNPLCIAGYYVIAMSEASSNLARYDGVRFGHRCQDPIDLTDLYRRSRAEGLGDEVKRRIMIGTYALSAGYYDAYYLKAQKIRRLIADDFRRAFEQVDVIIGPVAPTPAFPLGAKTDDPVQMYLGDIYTLSLNLVGLPGLSIPAGFSADLPVGLQLIGNYWDEIRLLAIAHQWQQTTDWHRAAPDFDLEP